MLSNFDSSTIDIRSRYSDLAVIWVVRGWNWIFFFSKTSSLAVGPTHYPVSEDKVSAEAKGGDKLLWCGQGNTSSFLYFWSIEYDFLQHDWRVYYVYIVSCCIHFLRFYVLALERFCGMSINYNPNHMYKSGFINACFNPNCTLNIINNIVAKISPLTRVSVHAM